MSVLGSTIFLKATGIVKKYLNLIGLKKLGFRDMVKIVNYGWGVGLSNSVTSEKNEPEEGLFPS